MDDIEKSISRGVRQISNLFESAVITIVRVFALPITLPVRLVKLSIPPTLHVLIFLSLLPLLGLFSISAGYLVAKWLPTGWSEPAFLQYGQGQIPYAYTLVKGLKSNQEYDITVYLTVPTSPPNLDLGNFMTTVTFMTTGNRTLSASRMPALLVAPTGLGRLWSGSMTTISIPMFQSFVPGYSNVRAKLEVGRPDGWTGLGKREPRELAVAEAYIKGNVRLSGLMAILAISPTTTAVVTSILFFFTATIIALILYFAVAPSFSEKPEEETTMTYPAGGEDPRPTRRLSRRPSREVKTEDRPAGILRRRRSRLSESPPPAASSSRVPPS